MKQKKLKEYDDLIKRLDEKIEAKCEYIDDYTKSICRDAVRINELKKDIEGLEYTIDKLKVDIAILLNEINDGDDDE